MTHNASITPEIRSTIENLEQFFSQPTVLEQLTKTANILLPQISVENPYAFKNIAINILDKNIPEVVGSIRIAVFFPGAKTKIERHPNSKQYLLSILGSGITRVLRDQVWEDDSYGDTLRNSLLETKWHFVEQNIWHQSIALENKPWLLAAIHTATDVEDQYQTE